MNYKRRWSRVAKARGIYKITKDCRNIYGKSWYRVDGNRI